MSQGRPQIFFSAIPFYPKSNSLILLNVSWFNLHSIYSILVRLNQKPLDSEVPHQNKNSITININSKGNIANYKTKIIHESERNRNQEILYK